MSSIKRVPRRPHHGTPTTNSSHGPSTTTSHPRSLPSNFFSQRRPRRAIALNRHHVSRTQASINSMGQRSKFHNTLPRSLNMISLVNFQDIMNQDHAPTTRSASQQSSSRVSTTLPLRAIMNPIHNHHPTRRINGSNHLFRHRVRQKVRVTHSNTSRTWVRTTRFLNRVLRHHGNLNKAHRINSNGTMYDEVNLHSLLRRVFPTTSRPRNVSLHHGTLHGTTTSTKDNASSGDSFRVHGSEAQGARGA